MCHLLFGIVFGCLCLLLRAVKGLFCCGMRWLVFGLWRVGLEAGNAWEDWCWGHQLSIYPFLAPWWPGKTLLCGFGWLANLGYVQVRIEPYSLRNHAQLEGGSVTERLMSTLAYGWVERCSDVAGCGASSSWDKYPFLFHLCNYIYCFMNYDGHIECWNVCVSSAECWATMYPCMFYAS